MCLGQMEALPRASPALAVESDDSMAKVVASLGYNAVVAALWVSTTQ